MILPSNVSTSPLSRMQTIKANGLFEIKNERKRVFFFFRRPSSLNSGLILIRTGEGFRRNELQKKKEKKEKKPELYTIFLVQKSNVAVLRLLYLN